MQWRMFQYSAVSATACARMMVVCMSFAVCTGWLTQPITKFDANQRLLGFTRHCRQPSPFKMYVPSWSNNHPIGSTSDKSKSPAELKSVGIDDSVIYAAASGIELHLDHIRTLQRDGYVVIPNFLSPYFVNALRVDLHPLRRIRPQLLLRIQQI